MEILSYSEARNNLKAVLDRVSDDCDYTVITRRDAPDAVVMSLDEFNSLQETLHVLGSLKNAERLNRSIEQYKKGQAKKRKLLND